MAQLNNNYLAGLFDGEGWISLKLGLKGCISTQIGIGMTHPVVKDIYKQYGGNLYIEKATNKHKKVYRWSLSNKQAVKEFLIPIKDNLIVKKKQSEIILRYINNSPKRSWRTPQQRKITSECAIALMKLNDKRKRKWNGDIND